MSEINAQTKSTLTPAQKKFGNSPIHHRPAPLPCPFCGSTIIQALRDKTSTGIVFHYYQCANCGVRTDGCTNYNHAIKVWNRRVGSNSDG